MDIAANWDKFALSEEGPTMVLPRRSAPLGNSTRFKPDGAPRNDSPARDTESNAWDFPDYLAVAGIVITLIGLALALIPETRRGGLLAPAGLILMAIAAYAARRRDETIA